MRQPCSPATAAHVLADDAHAPVAYPLPILAERVESAAAALRTLARSR